MELKVIAYARNGHTDKFGIPRQSRDESPILTRIVFEPEYRVPEALRGIEGFSHLWILWGFNAARPTASVGPSQSDCKTADAVRPQDKPAVGLSWSPTVRPPRLGGNKRMGVFATRSPYRPNPIGMSSVKLVGVANGQTANGEKGLELIVSGADVMDGTPIYDIKPYLSYSDSHEDAKNGFAEETKDYHLLITYYSPTNHLLEVLPEDVRKDIEYILSQDPRPAYQDDPEREYKMDYSGYRVTFTVDKGVVCVQNIEKSENNLHN